MEEVNFPIEYFDSIALIYAHFNGKTRTAYHKKLLASLKKGGNIIFEAYAKEQLDYQLKYGSGGPKDDATLFSLEEVKTEFAGVEFAGLEQLEINVREGKYHNGPSAVIRFTGKKL